MLELNGQSGVFDSWVERWRAHRGIDRWPIVPAKVVEKKYIQGGEGGNYELSLIYRVPAVNKDDQVLTVVILSVDEGSTHSGAEVGEVIELRAHPLKPQKAVFADTSQSASRLMIALVFIAALSCILLFRGCNKFFGDSH